MGPILGRGAFGTVYRATLRSHYRNILNGTLSSNNNDVAIKILPKSTIRSRGLASRVRNEVSLHYQLRHENILELQHFFEDEDNVYLVMEWAEGGDLYRRLKRQSIKNSNNNTNKCESKGFTVAEVRRWTRAIVEGLGYLHSHGIVHRDLKLSNILLSANLTPVQLLLLNSIKNDIEGNVDDQSHGNYHHHDDQVDNHDETSIANQTLCGTPNYLAPEVILKLPYGRAADRWSLGCLIYTMAVGRAPFEGIDIRQTFSRVKLGEFQLPDSLPSTLADLIRRLLVVNPRQRWTLDQVKRHPFLRENQKIDIVQSSLLCTQRLRPIQQRTRHGILRIRPNDRALIIDFDNVSDIMVVTANGKTINLYEKQAFRNQSETLSFQTTQLGQPSPSPIATFRYPWPDHMPQSIYYRYEYGKKFVNLLKSKTPQVILLTDTFRAFLMDNPVPPWDFQIRFSDGRRMEYLPKEASISLRDSNGVLLERITNIDRSESFNYRYGKELWEECLQRYEQCQKAAATSIVNGDPMANFPLIIDERHGHSSSSNGLNNHSDYNQQHLIELTLPQASQLMATIYSQHEHLRRHHSPHQSQRSNSATLPTSFINDNDRSFEYVYQTFLPEIGWCLASPSEQFLLLFMDGLTVLIDGRHNRVTYRHNHIYRSRNHHYLGDNMDNIIQTENDEGITKWHPIDQRLPGDLKQKLAYFPKFVNLLKAGQGRSFID